RPMAGGAADARWSRPHDRSLRPCPALLSRHLRPDLRRHHHRRGWRMAGLPPVHGAQPLSGGCMIPLPGLDKISLAAGAVAGGLVLGAAVYAWTQIVTIPAAKQETRAVVEAEAERRTLDAIKAVSDAAE